MLLKLVPHKHSSKFYWALFVSIVLLLLLAINSVFQWQFYQDRAMPNTFIGPLDVSNMTKRDIGILLLDSSRTTKLSINTDTSTRQVSYYEAGLGPDIYFMAQTSVNRPWWHHIIPAPLVSIVHRYEQPYTYAVDPEKISELARQINEVDAIPAQNARLDFADGAAVIVREQPGLSYAASALLQKLTNLPYAAKEPAFINPTEVPAIVTQSSFAQVKASAEQIINKTTTLVINGNTVTIPPEVIASWLSTTESETSFALSFKSDDIKSYVDGLNQTYFVPSQPGTVSLLDGAEVTRTDGQTGSGIDATTATQAIVDGLTKGDAVITLPLQNIAPRYTVNKNYSNSNSGLYSLLADLVSESGDYAISVQELGGAGRSADYKGTKEYVAASTYKLYIAYYALQQAEATILNFEAPFAGITVDRCFDLMIEHSDNYCANQFLNLFGRDILTTAVQQKGFTATRFDSDTIYTTANDLNTFLVMLGSNQLVNEHNTQKLLNLMKHQIYRNGIPTAAKDSVVANKVGYVNGYRHDTGIVYGPRSTYAVTITSYGGNYPRIVTIASRIHAFMQQ